MTGIDAMMMMMVERNEYRGLVACKVGKGRGEWWCWQVNEEEMKVTIRRGTGTNEYGYEGGI